MLLYNQATADKLHNIQLLVGAAFQFLNSLTQQLLNLALGIYDFILNKSQTFSFDFSQLHYATQNLF